MSDNINDTLNAIQTAFTELKTTNEARLAEMATKGAVDTLLDSKLAAINAEITDLQIKAQRPNINSDVSEGEAEYKAAWNSWARRGERFDQASLEKKAAMTIGSDTSAGVALPKQVETGLYAELETLSPIRQLATVVSTTSDYYGFLTNLHGMDAGWVGETDPRPETNAPKLTEVRVPAGEIYANPAVSQRAIDDLAFDVEAFIRDETAREFAIRENAAFIAGDGVNKPKGILTETGITTVKDRQGCCDARQRGLRISDDLRSTVRLPHRCELRRSVRYHARGPHCQGRQWELHLATLAGSWHAFDAWWILDCRSGRDARCCCWQPADGIWQHQAGLLDCGSYWHPDSARRIHEQAVR